VVIRIDFIRMLRSLLINNKFSINPMAQVLRSVTNENILAQENPTKIQKIADQPLRVKRLSEHATIPKRGSAFAAGYDLSRWDLEFESVFLSEPQFQPLSQSLS